MNEYLLKLKRDLEEQYWAISGKIDQSAVMEEVRKLTDELIEINHRVILINAHLFDILTKELELDVKKVLKKKDEVLKAIHDFESLNNVLQSIASFLGMVDNIIDRLKLI
jgi:hypothetical protein